MMDPMTTSAPHPYPVSLESPYAEILPAESARERYERLRDEVRVLVQAGDFKPALPLAEEALEVAEALGEPRRVAMARCNLAAVSMILGRDGEHVADLRHILMRNYDAETSFMAAYYLCYAYEERKEFKKALFYGRIARDRAEAADHEGYLASSYNQMGNSLSADSFFDDAVENYRRALDLSGDELTYVTVPMQFNLAYCELVLGRRSDGLSRLFRCLRWLRTHPMHAYRASTHLYLAFAYLELGRIRRAWLHGRCALESAEASGRADATKAALFMMGEIERAGGDLEASYDYFSRVQERFYPDQPQAPALLAGTLATSTGTTLATAVNLRAS